MDTKKAGKQHTTCHTSCTTFSNISLHFTSFGLSNSRENTKAGKYNLTFAPFCPVSDALCPDDRQEEAKGKHRGQKGMQGRSPAIYGSRQQGTPPLLGKRQVPFILIIFRTKNTEKSRLGLIGKNFGKNLWENVSGVKESPQSCGKGARR